MQNYTVRCARRQNVVQGSGSSEGLVIRQPRGTVSIAKVCISAGGNVHNQFKTSRRRSNMSLPRTLIANSMRPCSDAMRSNRMKDRKMKIVIIEC